MRATVLLGTITLVALTACARSDEPASDTGSTTAAVPAPAAPAPLQVADIDGTWNGTTMAAESDSVLRRWTTVRSSDSTGKLVFEGSRDSISYSIRLDADSMIATSVPFRRPGAARGPQVAFVSVGRLRDGKLVGTTTTVLAANRDSVVQRARYEATRVP